MSDPHAWRDRAACAGQPVETFFPTQAGKWPYLATIRRWCAPCPVRVECLEAELAEPLAARNGIRGGVLWAGDGGRARHACDPLGFLGEPP